MGAVLDGSLKPTSSNKSTLDVPLLDVVPVLAGAGLGGGAEPKPWLAPEGAAGKRGPADGGGILMPPPPGGGGRIPPVARGFGFDLAPSPFLFCVRNS